MLYNNTFEYAAVFLTVILLVLFYSRRVTFSPSSRYFMTLLIMEIGVAISDIVSSYTISYPYDVPVVLNTFLSAFFLFSYTSFIVVMMRYVDTLTKITVLYGKMRKITIGLVIYEFILLILSFFTTWFVYFDENRVYQHGPLFYLNYVLGFLCLVATITMAIKGRVKFSLYQRVTLTAFLIGFFLANGAQLFIPNLLLAGFLGVVVLVYFYMAFENPAYFYYKDTRCQNMDAFYRYMKRCAQDNNPISVVICSINDYEHVTSYLTSLTQRENYIRMIADRISFRFGKNAFLLSGDVFAITVPGGSRGLVREQRIETEVQELFEEDIVLPVRNVETSVSTLILPYDYRIDSFLDTENIIKGLVKSIGENKDMDIYERVDVSAKKTKRRIEVIRAIERGIEENDFKVVYQPILNVSTGKFESSEALVRLIDPVLGFVSPEEFIPISEEVGLVLDIGEIVFRKVCEFIRDHDCESLGIKYIEVNISPVQCNQPGIVDRYFSIMEEYGIEPSMVNFEITETAESEFKEDSIMVKNILEFSERGIVFSLDDFGSGFAAMDHLFQLPIDLVKVDKSILWQAMEDDNAMIVLKNTFRMVIELKKQILVEGVENQEMVSLLESYGCNFMQGYFFSKPISDTEYVEFLKERN